MYTNKGLVAHVKMALSSGWGEVTLWKLLNYVK